MIESTDTTVAVMGGCGLGVLLGRLLETGDILDTSVGLIFGVGEMELIGLGVNEVDVVGVFDGRMDIEVVFCEGFLHFFDPFAGLYLLECDSLLGLEFKDHNDELFALIRYLTIEGILANFHFMFNLI
jgi:hypothetical protein